MARGFVVLTNQLGFGADFLGLCYGVLSFVAARKLHVLRKSSRGWNTTNFFAASLLFGSVVRLLSFATASALNYLEISLGMTTSSAPVTGVGQPSDYVFYAKALEILVDFPHFITLSTYMLLALVWAEAILMSRRHLLSSLSLRRRWMGAYLVFNFALYAAQMALYIVFLLTSPANVATLVSALYLFLSCVDLAVPVAIFALITYVRCSLSGFPVSPSHQERAQAIARVAAVWTVARLLWGVVALSAVVFGWLEETVQPQWLYSLVLISVFVLCELVPYSIALGADLGSLLAGAPSVAPRPNDATHSAVTPLLQGAAGSPGRGEVGARAAPGLGPRLVLRPLQDAAVPVVPARQLLPAELVWASDARPESVCRAMWRKDGAREATLCLASMHVFAAASATTVVGATAREGRRAALMGGPGALPPSAADGGAMGAVPLALLVPSLPGEEGRTAVAGDTARLLSKRCRYLASNAEGMMPALALAATPVSRGGAESPPESGRSFEGDSSGGDEEEDGGDKRAAAQPADAQGEVAAQQDSSPPSGAGGGSGPARRQRGSWGRRRRRTAQSRAAPCASVTIAAPWPYAITVASLVTPIQGESAAVSALTRLRWARTLLETVAAVHASTESWLGATFPRESSDERSESRPWQRPWLGGICVDAIALASPSELRLCTWTAALRGQPLRGHRAALAAFAASMQRLDAADAAAAVWHILVGSPMEELCRDAVAEEATYLQESGTSGADGGGQTTPLAWSAILPRSFDAFSAAYDRASMPQALRKRLFCLVCDVASCIATLERAAALLASWERQADDGSRGDANRVFPSG